MFIYCLVLLFVTSLFLTVSLPLQAIVFILLVEIFGPYMALTCCATNWKVTGSIPASVSGFFIDIKSFRSHYGPGVDSASNRNEYREHKGGRCVRLTTLPPSCAVVTKSGNLNFLEPSGLLGGLLRDCFTFSFTVISRHIFNTPPSPGCGLDSPEFDSQREEDIFSSPKFQSFKTGCGAHPTSCPWGTYVSFLGVKGSKR